MDSLSQLYQHTLSYTNFQFCKDALVIHSTLLDAEYLLQSEIAAPVDPAAAACHTKKAYKVKALIMQSLPNSIIKQIPTEILKKSPFQIIRVLSHHVRQNNMKDHDPLDSEARSIILTFDKTIKAYVTQNLSLRRKMLKAEFPNISDERTTVKYLINGLKSNPDFYQLSMIMAGSPPSTIREYTNRLQQATLVQKTVCAS